MNGGGGINNLPPHPNSRPRFIKGPFPSFLPCQIGIGLPPSQRGATKTLIVKIKAKKEQKKEEARGERKIDGDDSAAISSLWCERWYIELPSPNQTTINQKTDHQSNWKGREEKVHVSMVS